MNAENQRAPLFPSRLSLGWSVLGIAFVALVYFAAARLSLLLEFEPEGIAAIWPPEGVFLSAILLTRRALRFYLVATLCLADFAAELLAGTPFSVSAMYALILTGNAVLSAWLLLRFVGERITFTKVREVLGFVVLAVIFSNALWSLAAAAASQLLPGASSFWNSWKWWAASDGIGNLLVTPLLLSWASWPGGSLTTWNRQRVLEGAALFLPLALLNLFTFRHLSESGQFSLLLPYVTFPFLLWAALRFGVRGVTSALVILAAIAVSFAVVVPIPGFPFYGSPLNTVIGVQLYLAILAIPSLFMVAVVSERKKTEEALRASEERFKVIAMNTPDHILVQDADLRYLWVVNPQLGLTKEDIIGKTDFDLLGREEAEKLTKIKREVLASGEPAHVELPICLNGNVEYFEGSYVPKHGPDGAIDGLIGYFRNVTERKRAEEALQQSEGLYRSLFENMMNGFAYCQMLFEQGRPRDFIYLSVNKAFEAQTGLKNVVGKKASEAIPGIRESDPELFEIYGRVALTGTPEVFETYVQALNMWFAISVYSPRREYFVAVFDVITERKREEQALRESEERFRAAFEESAVAMALTALDSTLLKVNPAFCRMLGFSASELVGRSFTAITHPDDRAANLVGVQRLISGAVSSFRMEKRYLRKDGAVVWGDMNTASVRDDQGRPLYCVTHIQDITDRKQAEEALRRLNEQLERQVAQRTEALRHTVGRLQQLTLEISQTEDRERRRIADLLHDDVQQILAAAKFHLNLLDGETRSPAESQEIIEQVKHMLKEAIEKARSLSHELSPVLYQVDLVEILNWLARHMQRKHGLIVRVEADAPVDLPSEPLKAVLYKMAQELLSNVVKHAGVNEARIRVRRGGRCIYLSVVDQGRGFDPERLEGVAGFGLLGIRERVQLLGGRMKIRSRPGAGSRLLIAVPDEVPFPAAAPTERGDERKTA